MTKTYQIKPLEWIDNGYWRCAKTPFGDYYASGYKWRFRFFDGHCCDSIEAGMTAAEADWEDRLRDALEALES